MDPDRHERTEVTEMESNRFDRLTSGLTTTDRRSVLRFVAAAVFGVGSLALVRQDEAAAKRKHRHKKHRSRGGGGSSGPTKGLRQVCTPGVDTCSSGLECSSPTTRHTCSSTVEGVRDWCCVPPNHFCSGECDCCGSFYCSFENGSSGFCIPNPEG